MKYKFEPVSVILLISLGAVATVGIWFFGWLAYCAFKLWEYGVVNTTYEQLLYGLGVIPFILVFGSLYRRSQREQVIQVERPPEPTIDELMEQSLPQGVDKKQAEVYQELKDMIANGELEAEVTPEENELLQKVIVHDKKGRWTIPKQAEATVQNPKTTIPSPSSVAPAPPPTTLQVQEQTTETVKPQVKIPDEVLLAKRNRWETLSATEPDFDPLGNGGVSFEDIVTKDAKSLLFDPRVKKRFYWAGELQDGKIVITKLKVRGFYNEGKNDDKETVVPKVTLTEEPKKPEPEKPKDRYTLHRSIP